MLYVHMKANVINVALFTESHKNVVTTSTLETIKINLKKNGTTLKIFGPKGTVQ